MDTLGTLYNSPLFLVDALTRSPQAFWGRDQIRALLFTAMDGSTQLRELDPDLRMYLARCAKDASDDAVLAAWMRPLRELCEARVRDTELAESLYELANTALTHADLELSAVCVEAGLRQDAGHPGLRLMELELRYREGEIELEEALFQLSSRSWPQAEEEPARERLVTLITPAG